MIAPTSVTSEAPNQLARRDHCGGFSLMETVLALALIGLLAALVLPWVLPDQSSTSLRIRAFEIAALLRADRNAALRSGRPVATTIDLAKRRVFSGATGAALVLPDAFDLKLASTEPSGFHFFPDGRASGGELTIGRRDAALGVRVNRLTAAISIVAR